MSDDIYYLLRSTAHPDGLPGVSQRDLQYLELANRVTGNSFILVDALCAAGASVSIENPHGSMLWHCSAYKAWAAKYKPDIIVLDYCTYGEPFRKRTRLVTWHAGSRVKASFLKSIEKKCPGTHTHVNLSGWRPIGKKKTVMRSTRGSAAYPVSLCRCWAHAVHAHLTGS